jgi:hypothetical protein
MPTTSSGDSSVVGRDVELDAALLAVLDTGAAIGLGDALSPAATGLAGTPGLTIPEVFEAAGCVPVVDVGPLVGLLAAAEGGVVTALGLVGELGLDDAFDC